MARKLGRRKLAVIVLAAAALSVAAIALGCGPLRRAVRAARVLGEIAAHEEDPGAEPVLAESVEFETPAGPTAGTLFRLADPLEPRPGLVLCHGAAEDGFRDRRLVRLARALARAGFVVLAPDLVELSRLEVEPRSIGRIEGAVLHLMSRIDLVGDNPVSLAGISFAGSFCILAASRPPLDGAVGAVLAFGAYHDLEALVRYWLVAPAPDIEGVYPVASYGRWIVVRNNLDALAPPGDRAPIRAALTDLLHGKGAPPAPADLSAEGAALYAAVKSPGPLPDGVATDVLAAARPLLAAIDVRGRIASLRAPLFVLHAAGDELVPDSHSEAIAAEAEGRVPVRLLVSDAFRHVTVSSGESRGLFDALPEILFVAAFFREAGI